MKLLMIGFNQYVNLERIVSILNLYTSASSSSKPRISSPIKKVLDGAEEHNLLVNASAGHSRKSAIIMDSGHVIISSVESKTLIGRMEKKDAPISG